MSDARNRSWRELAEAACAEHDPEKLIRIVEELNRTLEEHSDRQERNHASKAEDVGCDSRTHPSPIYCF